MQKIRQLTQLLQRVMRRFSVLRFGNEAGRRFSFIGDDSHTQFWEQAILGKRASQGRRIPRLGSLRQAAMAAARRHGFCVVLNLRMPAEDTCAALRIPQFVDLELPFGKDIEAYRAGLSMNLRNETRRCERLFEVRYSEKDEDLVRFAEAYHVPTAENRYGEEAVALGIDRLRERHHNGLLLQVWHEGRWIGGVTILRREDNIKIDSLGILGGDREGLPRLTITAIYWFSFRYAMEQGYAHCALGGTTPLLESGLHRFKDKWQVRANAHSTYPAPQYLFFDPLHPACHDFFRTHTLYFWDGDDDHLSLVGSIADPAELEKRVLRFSVVQSLAGVYTINPDYPEEHRLPPNPRWPRALRERLIRIH